MEVVQISEYTALGKKAIKGKKEDDPDWIIDIASYLFLKRLNKTDKRYKLLKELFLEYRNEGLSSRNAFKKAKRVLDSFEIEW